MPLRQSLALLLFVCVGTGAASEPCRDLSFEETSFTVCSVDARQSDLRLWLRDTSGETIGSFRALETMLDTEGKTLGFAMNAGMYHDDRRPVGLYVENGLEIARIITSAGPGNFGLLPNGVFCLNDDGTAEIVESRAFVAAQTDCRFASQSGPMLVIDGALHPRLIPDSDSRFLRNGVGVGADGRTLHFAISNRPVNFHRFARLFRDALDAPNALYFDGNVSRLHAPGLGRSDAGRQMGPIVGLVVPR